MPKTSADDFVTFRESSGHDSTPCVIYMPDRQKFSWEAAYPYALGVMAAFAVSRFDVGTPKVINDAGFNVPSFFAVVQNIELFGTGILFSIFVFTMAPAAGFMAKLHASKTFLIFRRYVIEAMVLGLLGTIAVTPLASARQPETFALWWMPLAIVLNVFFASAFLLAIFRVVRVFLFWSKQ